MKRLPPFIKTLVYPVIFILFGAYVFFYETEDSKDKNHMNEEPKVRLDFDTNEVVEIELGNRVNRLHFIRREGKWGLKNNNSHSVDDKAINHLLEIFDYGIIDVVEENSSILDEYGLDKPDIILGIRNKEGAFKSLLLGDEHPTGLSCYAKTGSESRIYLLGIRYKTDLNQFIGSSLAQVSGSQGS